MSMVHHPAHYGGGDNPYEVIKVLEAWGLDKDAYLFNVVKYIARAGKKPDQPLVQDLKKAIWYLERKINSLEDSEKIGKKEPLINGTILRIAKAAGGFKVGSYFKITAGYSTVNSNTDTIVYYGDIADDNENWNWCGHGNYRLPHSFVDDGIAAVTATVL